MPTGWVGSTRAETLPPDWNRRRLACLRRDGHQCQHVRADTGTLCRDKANQVDHVNDREDHSPGNLQSLCEYHHQLKSSSQGGSANARKNYGRKRPQHPGIIA